MKCRKHLQMPFMNYFFFWRQGFYFKERKAGQKQTKHEETHDICLMSLLTKGVDG